MSSFCTAKATHIFSAKNFSQFALDLNFNESLTNDIVSFEQLGPGKPGPEVIKKISCSTQLGMKFVLLINLKLLTITNSFLLNIAEHENFSAYTYENANWCWHFHIY